MDADVIDRIKRFLYENGYYAGKGDIDWILDQMCEDLIEKYESYLHTWILMNKNKLRYKCDTTNKYYMKR